MAAPSASRDASSTHTPIFDNITFWIARRCPFRSWFVEQVKMRGGTITLFENKADISIDDHIRNDNKQNTYSYTFIEKCIADGVLVDLKDHLTVPDAPVARPVGSAVPGKSTRTKFTAEEDELLAKWVRDCERQGGKIFGNEIYKQLEQVNSRHTWQSWQDRYKRVIHGRQGKPTPVQETPPTPPSENGGDEPATNPTNQPTVETPEVQGSESRPVTQSVSAPLTEDTINQMSPSQALQQHPSPEHGILPTEPKADNSSGNTAEAAQDPAEALVTNVSTDLKFESTVRWLLDQTPQLLNIPPSEVERAWLDFAKDFPERSAEEWRKFHEDHVLPRYEQLSVQERLIEEREADVKRREQLVDEEEARITKWAKRLSRSRDAAVNRDSEGNVPNEPRVALTEIESEDEIAREYLDSQNIRGTSAQRRRDPLGLDPRRTEQTPTKSVSENKKRKSDDLDTQEPVRDNVKRRLSRPGMDSSSPLSRPQSKSESLRASEAIPGDLEKENHQGSGSSAGFEIYESTGVPEGEEENWNAVTPETLTRTARRKRKRNEEALEVFGDEPSRFSLVPTIVPQPGLSPIYEASQDVDTMGETNEEIEGESEDGESTPQPLPLTQKDMGDSPEVLSRIFNTIESEDNPDERSRIFSTQEVPSRESPELSGEGNEDEDSMDLFVAQDVLKSDTIVPDLDVPSPGDNFTFDQDEVSDSSEDENENSLGNSTRHLPSRFLGQTQSQDDISQVLEIPESQQSERDNDEYHTAPASHPPHESLSPDLDTQAILNANTQQPDLNIELPESSEAAIRLGSENDGLPPTFSSLTQHQMSRNPLREASSFDTSHSRGIPVHRSRQKHLDENSDKESQDSDEKLLEDFVASKTSDGRYDPNDVVWALQRTTMNLELADVVLESLEKGDGLPQGVPGIWTEDEDEILRGGDAKLMKQLEKKHGPEAFMAHVEHLENWED